MNIQLSDHFTFSLSALRMLVFQLLCVMVIPVFLGTDGIWLSMLFAESGTIIFTICFMLKYRRKYGY